MLVASRWQTAPPLVACEHRNGPDGKPGCGSDAAGDDERKRHEFGDGSRRFDKIPVFPDGFIRLETRYSTAFRGHIPP
jgi:hypothetical protein